MFNKIFFLKITLYLGAIYYAIGGISHYFGLTIFPFFVHNLYAPYQDSLIAFICLFLIMLLLTAARDPLKNLDLLNVIIVGAFLGSIFSIAIIWKINFAALGAADKKIQTITEGILGFLFTAALWYLRPKQPEQQNLATKNQL